MEKKEPDKNVTINALWNAFPSVSSFLDFKEKDREVSKRAIPRIIDFVYKKNIIDERNEKAFLDFLAKNTKADLDKTLPEDLTFADFIETLCGNRSVNSLISQLEIITEELFLPKIKASMITRLKKNFDLNTAKKRTLLRILAYKLAERRPDLNWHYEMLSKFPVSSVQDVKETAGITIRLNLQGMGEIVVPEDIYWLRTELSKCIEYLNLAGLINNKTIEPSSATSFNLRLPKKQGPLDEPRLYDRAIRDILAIAHQMAVRWLFSEYSSPKKQMAIIIHGGLMSEANLFIQPLLETKLIEDSGIYLSDFACLCARVAEVKVGFKRYTDKRNPGGIYTGDIWAVNYFFAYNYYDYIPNLLEEKMLPKSSSEISYVAFQNALYFPEQFPQSSFEALWAMNRFPQNTLLLIEIAKVLRARQMPYEADTVISNLLLSDPYNVIARIMRMLIYENIAHSQTDFFISELAFNRAIAEGEFITRRCDIDEISWCEIGLLYYGRAKKYIKCLRENNPVYTQKINKEDAMDNLKKAAEYFLRGMAASPTGKDASSFFWFLCTRSFIELFSSDEKLFSKKEYISLVDNNNVFKKIGNGIFIEIGYLRNEFSPDREISESAFQNFINTLVFVIPRYENSLLSRSYIPYSKYLFCQLMWDFAPRLTMGICNQILSWLNEASIETKKLIGDNISVYKASINYISADKFLIQIQETIDIIKKFVTDDELKKGDNSPIDQNRLKEMSKTKLILWELDRYQV